MVLLNGIFTRPFKGFTFRYNCMYWKDTHSPMLGALPWYGAIAHNLPNDSLQYIGTTWKLDMNGMWTTSCQNNNRGVFWAQFCNRFQDEVLESIANIDVRYKVVHNELNNFMRKIRQLGLLEYFAIPCSFKDFTKHRNIVFDVILILVLVLYPPWYQVYTNVVWLI
jgi:hypothetical protein